MMFIDSHAHVSEPPLLPRIEEILQRSRSAKIEKIVNICTDLNSLREGLLLAEKYPEIVNVGCTPPHDVEKEGDSAFDTFAEAAYAGKLVAIGETGLDYYYEHSPKLKQHIFLKKYLALAAECNLPVVFHCREAFSDLFSMTDNMGFSAMLHCFTGTHEEAAEVLKRGWMLSFSGIVTFKKSGELREIAKKAPLSQILIETDAPFLAPQSRRGEINEPSYLLETAGYLAELKGIPLEEFALATSENGKRFFRLV